MDSTAKSGSPETRLLHTSPGLLYSSSFHPGNTAPAGPTPSPPPSTCSAYSSLCVINPPKPPRLPPPPVPPPPLLASSLRRRKWRQRGVYRTRHNWTSPRMCSGSHPAPCGTSTTTWRHPRHAHCRRFQWNYMVHSLQCRDHCSAVRRNHSHGTPGGIHSRRLQRAIRAGQWSHGPPHGMCQHRHDPPRG